MMRAISAAFPASPPPGSQSSVELPQTVNFFYHSTADPLWQDRKRAAAQNKKRGRQAAAQKFYSVISSQT
jgi:hypothetical protein